MNRNKEMFLSSGASLFYEGTSHAQGTVRNVLKITKMSKS